MPIPISFTERDLKRGATVEPDFYLVRIDDVGVKPSNDGGSTNYPIDITVIKNANNGSEKFNDVPMTFNFNSKAMGFALGFMKVLNPELEVKADQKYDLESAKGQMIEVFIGNKEYNGRILNDVKTETFRAAGTGERMKTNAGQPVTA